MENSRIARENAEVAQTGAPAPHRSEKGTAGIIIAAENAARQEKTERLKAARLARVESESAAPPEPATKKGAGRKTGAKTAKAKTSKKSASPARKKEAAV